MFQLADSIFISVGDRDGKVDDGINDALMLDFWCVEQRNSIGRGKSQVTGTVVSTALIMIIR